jgi:hypothetical protein
LHHALLDHGALAARVARHHAAAHDGVAEEPAPPQIDGGIDRFADAVPGAEHEQQVGGPERRRYQVLGIDAGDLGIARPNVRRFAQFRNSAITR